MQKAPLSIRIIYILTSIVYYITAISCLFMVILSFTILTGLFELKDLQLNVEMPVEVNFNEIGSTYFNEQKIDVEIVEAIGKVHFIDTPAFLARRLIIPLLIVFSMLFWIVFLFHRFMRNVSEGNIFIKRNFQLLRTLGISLLGFWLVAVIYMQLFKHLIIHNFSFERIEIINSNRWFAGIFIGALFTLVLSHIFLKGQELEEENELTI